MSHPERPDQRPGQLARGTPGSRSGSSETALSLDTSGLALNETVAQVNSTLGTPQQDATGQALNEQIVNAGAQPWVPNLRSASSILQGPGASPDSFFTFTANSRIWAATVTVGAGQSGGSGTSNIYALVKTGGGVVLAIVEIAVEGSGTSDSGTCPQQVPGLPVLSGDKLVLVINGGTTLTGGLIRASASVLYSVP